MIAYLNFVWKQNEHNYKVERIFIFKMKATKHFQIYSALIQASKIYARE